MKVMGNIVVVGTSKNGGGYLKDSHGTMVYPIVGTNLVLFVNSQVGVQVVDTQPAGFTIGGEFKVVHTYPLAGAQAIKVSGNMVVVGTARNGGSNVLEELDISN
eukprot:Sspe_Gene.31489::Locus_15531_Transcript_2_2_Confidence_0.875_Length_502::g.31489::m.31489